MIIKLLRKEIKKIIGITAFLLPSVFAWAGVQVIGTRVVFYEDKGSASLPIENGGTRPYLVQAWVDDGEDMGGPSEEGATSFDVTPELSRLDGGKQNILRIMLNEDESVKAQPAAASQTPQNAQMVKSCPHPLPRDRESVCWLNVKEIPEAPKGQNVLQLAMRSRMKLFFRPIGLADKSNPQEAYSQLKWSVVKNSEQQVVKQDGKADKSEPKQHSAYSLQADNPTPYFITLSSLVVDDHKEGVPVEVMVPPFGRALYPLGKLSGAKTLSYQAINDYGAETPATKVTLAPQI